jgi:glyoxylase-like metal-dependent hydrolase (beta-lactamase superfamily II)
VLGRDAWARAQNPHPRDRASFVPELNRQLEESGRLQLVDAGEQIEIGGLRLRFFVSEGHTPGMLCSTIDLGERQLVFAADLIPGRPWVHLPITMGYDRFPERLIDEKDRLLAGLAERGDWLFFTHDAAVAAGRVACDPEKGKYFVDREIASFRREPSEAFA